MGTGPTGGSVGNVTLQKVTWLDETVEKQAPGQRPFRLALGWCGRGFIESVVSVKGDNAAKA